MTGDETKKRHNAQKLTKNVNLEFRYTGIWNVALKLKSTSPSPRCAMFHLEGSLIQFALYLYGFNDL